MSGCVITMSSNHNLNSNKQNTEDLKQEFIPTRVLVFDLVGPFAHFRNIQTNSSSLTYIFPPPTTIQGIIAAIIGMERDSYYSIFKPENTFIAVDVIETVKMQIHTINYRNIEDKGYVQIPLEVIMPLEGDMLRFRIYFSLTDQKIYDKLKERLSENRSYYPIYLGLSEFIASVEFLEEKDISTIIADKGIKISTIVGTDGLEILEIPEGVVLCPEYMRLNFKEQRVLGRMVRYMYISSGNIIIKPSNSIFKIVTNQKEKYICRL